MNSEITMIVMRFIYSSNVKRRQMRKKYVEFKSKEE